VTSPPFIEASLKVDVWIETIIWTAISLLFLYFFPNKKTDPPPPTPHNPTPPPPPPPPLFVPTDARTMILSLFSPARHLVFIPFPTSDDDLFRSPLPVSPFPPSHSPFTTSLVCLRLIWSRNDSLN